MRSSYLGWQGRETSLQDPDVAEVDHLHPPLVNQLDEEVAASIRGVGHSSQLEDDLGSAPFLVHFGSHQHALKVEFMITELRGEPSF